MDLEVLSPQSDPHAGQEARQEAKPAAHEVDLEVSIIVPVLTSDAEVRDVVRALGGELDREGRSWECIFVFDGVRGSAWQTAQELGVEYGEKVRTISFTRSFGESVCLSAGHETSRGRFLVTSPQYVQVDPVDLGPMLAALEQGADLVSAWRKPRVDPWLNRMQSACFNWVIRLIIPGRFHDLNCYFRALRREVLDEVAIYGDIYRFLPVIALRHGYRVVEVPARHLKEWGQAGFFGVGVYVRRVLDILGVMFVTRFALKPLRFFGSVGLLFSLLGFVVLAICSYQKFAEQEGLYNRPAFMLGVMMLVLGVQIIGFGLVGEIIIYTQSRNFREYRIERIYDPVTGASDLLVRALSDDDAQEAFSASSARATFFHRPGWARVVARVFGAERCDLGAWAGDGELAGVLPLARCKGPFGKRNLISMPWAVYGGAVGRDAASEHALLAAAEQLARQEGVGRLELRCIEAPEGCALPRSELYSTFIQELPERAEDVLGSIPKKARAEARKARSEHGLELVEGRWYLDDLYRLFQQNKQSLGSPGLPLRWFRDLAQEFGRDVVVHLVHRERQPLAAVMSFVWHDTLLAYYAGTAPGADRAYSASNFMYMALREWAVGAGFKRFDFGRSRADAGAFGFKKRQGFEPRALDYRFALVKDAALPSFNPSNPRTRVLRNTWSKLPSWLALRLSDRLARYLP